MSRHGVREVKRQLRESGAVGVVAVLLVTVTSALAGALWTVRAWVHEELLTRDRASTVVAIVRGPTEADLLRTQLPTSFPGVTVVALSPHKVQEQLAGWFPELSSMLLTLEDRSFPALLQVEVNPRDEESVVSWLRRRPEVTIVESSRAWQARLRSAMSRVLLGGFLLTTAMLLGCCVVVLLVVRLLVVAHADEIAIMRLIGAHDGDIRRPYLVSGSILGLFGGLGGLALLLAAGFAVRGALPTLSIEAVTIATLPVAGALAGLIGAAFGLASLPKEP
ncbi:MAG: FtsX-like permease family protein [Thermoanaerobaculales bacterium]